VDDDQTRNEQDLNISHEGRNPVLQRVAEAEGFRKAVRRTLGCAFLNFRSHPRARKLCDLNENLVRLHAKSVPGVVRRVHGFAELGQFMRACMQLIDLKPVSSKGLRTRCNWPDGNGNWPAA